MLAGRSQPQNMLPSIYWHSGVRDIPIVGIQTHARAWYPAPQGSGDQRMALNGIPHSIRIIEAVVRTIQYNWNIEKNRIVLLGFSAGGVMAIQVAAYSQDPYAGVICQSGAILSPDSLPKCNCPTTQFLLTHSQDDCTFSWDERYTPMKKSLKYCGYNVSTVESPFGGHSLNYVDVAFAKLFARKCLA